MECRRRGVEGRGYIEGRGNKMAEVGGCRGGGGREYIEGRGKNGRGRWVERCRS